jgi:hypothetical protein
MPSAMSHGPCRPQVDTSVFCDFQRVRVQENANEIPAGSMPRCMDVVVRNEIADRAKPGDKCVFTGTLIAVPDLAQLRGGHDRPEAVRETGGRSSYATEGITGLRALGVRELNYRLNFLACAVHLADAAGAHPPPPPPPPRTPLPPPYSSSSYAPRTQFCARSLPARATADRAARGAGGCVPFRDEGEEGLSEHFDEETIRDAGQIRSALPPRAPPAPPARPPPNPARQPHAVSAQQSRA